MVKTQQKAPVKPELRPVDERGVVRRGVGGLAKAAAPKTRVDRTIPGKPTGPITNKNKGSQLQKGSTGPLPFNPRRSGAGMTNQVAGRAKPATPRRGGK
jgi:hypothetical protein